MAGLTPKDKAALSYLYELDEFKAFKKLCLTKRAKVAEMIISADTSQEGALQKIAMLQGQAYALQLILLEMNSIHKKAISTAVREKTQKKR